MAQACDGFTKKTLMGNWYEEREAPVQPFRENLEDKQMRDKDYSIAIATSTGQLQPLPRVKRNQPWVTSGVIPNDGFKEFRSNQSTGNDLINLQNFYQLGDKRNVIKTQGQKIVYPENSQNHIQTHSANHPKMINEENFKEVLANRQVVQNSIGKHTSDFGSVFKKHDANHDKLFDQTSHHAAFKKPEKDTVEKLVQFHDKDKNTYHGYNDRPYDQQAIQAISTLTGEYHKHYSEPKDNTAIQRQWLPYSDKALQFADQNIKNNIQKNIQEGKEQLNPMQTYKNNMQQKLPYDIATSLPLGNGEREFHSKNPNPGQFRHIRQDVTRVMNQPITKK